MAQTDQASVGSDSHPEICPTVEKLLQEVTTEINKFEAKKLNQLKTDLEAFQRTQNALVDDYKTKYPQLRDRWCKQHQQIETLYSALKCAFPNQDWKEIVKKCICPTRHTLYCLEKKYKARKRCCSGKIERDRDNAKHRFDTAQARLDVLKTLAQKIDGELTLDAKWITEIQAYLANPEKAVALYPFYFKLLPSHKQLTPDDVPDAYKSFAVDDTPEKLCKDEPCAGPDVDEGACTPPADDSPDANQPRALPWLIPKTDYRNRLDCAWQDYRTAKDDYATKEAAYKDKPDDLDSVTKAIEHKKTGLDDEIKTCLMKAEKPQDECSKQASH